MSTDPQQEHLAHYFMQDRSDDELSLLYVQDQFLTASVGGVLPEQPDPTIFRRVLDVGCGTGAWVIEVAKAYPETVKLVGVDINRKMVEFAQAQAVKEQVADRVEFHPMNALRSLEFPYDYFDLVNQRQGWLFLRTWDWPKLFSEYKRITRPGGVIRITEADITFDSTSRALNLLSLLSMRAFSKAGHLFSPQYNGFTRDLAPMLLRHDFENVQARLYKLECYAGTPEGQALAADMAHFYRGILPFFQQWTQVPEDYETIYQEMLQEVQQPSFKITWTMLTAWANKPEQQPSPEEG